MELKRRHLLALLLALALTLSLAPALAEEAVEDVPQENFFATLPLTYLDGTPFDSSVFIGKPILLNIWATWCPPCIGEMPHLNELAVAYADKINIIGLHSEGLTFVEGQGLVPDEVKNLTALELQEEMGLTFPLLNPDVNLFLLVNDPQYGVNISVLPTTWLIDGEGYIRGIIESAMDKEGWTQVIDKFLADLMENADETSGS